MKVQRRFAFQFLTQFITLCILLGILLFALVLIFGKIVSDEDLSSDLLTIDDFSYDYHINAHYEIDDALKKAVRTQNVWLLVYDKNYHLKTAYNVPKNAPKAYDTLLKDDTILYNMESVTLGEHIQSYVIVGKKNESAITLDKVRQRVNWQSATLPQIDSQQRIYYVDKDGHVLDTRNVTKKDATVEALYYRHQYTVARYTDETTGKQLIVATKNIDDDILKVLKRMLSPIIILGLISLCCFIVFIYFYTRKFANPLMLLMEWIRQIGQKNYDLPLNKKQQPLFRTKKGRVRQRFKLYKDMIVTMEHMTDELKKHDAERHQMDKMREEWISGLSHDLKTPLSTIIGYTKMMRSTHEWTPKEQQQFLEVMDDKATYMKELIDDLTLTYRLKNARVPLQREQVEMNEWLRRKLIHWMSTAEAEQYTFDFHTSHPTLYAQIDPVLFQRVIDNLLINAMKHNPPGTIIAIETTVVAQQLQIIFKDNGIGMDEQTVAQLFNRYYRGTTTTEQSEGTGLGMAITEQLVKLHGGYIVAQSDINVGTTIIITLAMESTFS